jgi:hypothetical protein
MKQYRDSPEVDDWIREAKETDIVQGWERTSGPGRTNLKRTAGELVGPCPVCGGTNRFAINQRKQVFVCRGASAGGVIKLVEHVEGVGFLDAVELLTGRPKPGGRRELSEQERQDLARKRQQQDEMNAQRRRDQEERDRRDRERRLSSARGVWQEALPIDGTMAESYLEGRGLDCRRLYRSVLRFHPGLPYPDRPGTIPALVAKVSAPDGTGTGIWRIFLGDGPKGRARVPNAKLGLGVVRGGAVRIGGISDTIGIAEGVETALAAAEISGWAYPVWAALSTSGMMTFEPPPGVKRVVIFPDYDLPKLGDDGVYRAAPGLHAAEKLLERLAGSPVAGSMIPRPLGFQRDFVDLLRISKGLPVEA